jgi:excisionase family DNA binding protein
MSNNRTSGVGARVFTTGQAARICGVAPRTLSKWIDAGRLKGYRIPGSDDRRVPRENLVRFLTDHGMPLGELAGGGAVKVLLVGTDAAFNARLETLLGDGFAFACAADGFAAGLLAGRGAAAAVVLDFALGRSECVRMAAALRRDGAFAAALVVGLAGEDEPATDAASQYGFDRVFRRPFDPAAVAAAVRKLA